MDPATLLVTALALAAFGTGGDATTTTTTAPPALEEPIVLTVGGGEVGGVDRRVRISPDGGAWVRGGGGARLGFDLDRRQLSSVATAADLAFAHGSGRLPMRCLDCTLYSVRKGSRRLTFDAIGFDRSGFRRHLVTTILRSVPAGMAR